MKRHLEIGTQIQQYVITALVAQGGMGAIYKALDTTNEDHVNTPSLALKTIQPDFAPNPELRARFEREIIVMRALQHPNIVPLLDSGESHGLLWFVMPYIDGWSLSDWLTLHTFTPADVVTVLQPLCSALSYAHGLGVVHRDVKPQNILLEFKSESKSESKSDAPHVYLVDFGLSKVAGMVSLTDDAVSVGTPEYMAPEQVMDEPLTPATDLYALSIVLYEMLLGKLPFVANTPLDAALARVESAPLPPRQVRPDFPPALESILLRGLEKDPNKRYSDAEQFYADYLRVLDHL
jgi:eukaryotic-like serine/threonine-protein kinase